MANGQTRDWDRVLFTINGFRQRFGVWPATVRLEQGYIHEFRGHLFTPASWTKVEEKLRFVAEETAKIVAEDEQGRRHGYGEDPGSKDRPVPSAEEWLGVSPDAGDHAW